MNSIFKKIFGAGILLCFSTLAFTANASDKTKLSDYAYSVGEAEVTNINGNVVLHKQKFETMYNGNNDPSNPTYKFDKHTVQWVDSDLDTGTRVVTFSNRYRHRWSSITTRAACELFEKENPGWQVVAGINGDFFNISSTKEPTNSFMQDGDLLRPENSDSYYRGVLGFNDDGTIIEGKPTITNNMQLKVYNDDKSEITSTVDITAVNTDPSATGITLITPDCKKDVDLTGYTVLVGSYELCRISTGGYVFVKGTIESSSTTVGKGLPDLGKFYLATKDDSLKNVKIDDYVKCEYSYTDKWQNVKNSIGYVHNTLIDFKPQHQGSRDSFIYTNHPRTLFGIKENGGVVMMVVDGRGNDLEYKTGVSLFQAGELLRLAGCKNGYNLDGGGSSTLVVKNQKGKFEVVNTPSDGNERSDGNHVLIVMRDPGFKVKANPTFNSLDVSLDIYNEQFFATCQDIQVEINGTKLPISKDKPAVFKGLPKDKEYEVAITYKNKDQYGTDKLVNNKSMQRLSTVDIDDSKLFSVSDISMTSVKVNFNKEDPLAPLVKDAVIHLGDSTFSLGTQDSVKCAGLIGDTTYDFYVTYTLDDKESNLQYEEQTTTVQVKTLSFELPVIEKFNLSKKGNDYFAFEYKYIDKDDKVTKAYIQYNDSQKELTYKLGSNFKVDGLDLTKTYSYTFKLVLEYEVDGKTQKVVSEEIVQAETIEEAKPEENKQEKKGCKDAAVQFVIAGISAITMIAVVFRRK